MFGFVDECSTGDHNCDRNAVCIDEDDGFTCVCNNGYNGNGQFCNDVNECRDPDACPENATCKNKGIRYKHITIYI